MANAGTELLPPPNAAATAAERDASPLAAAIKLPSSLFAAAMRGLRRRCPRCGEGASFRGYLKIAAHCPACGVDLGSYRADDAPPYVTIFIVGHIVVPAMLLLEQSAHPATWVHMALWLPLTLALTLALLPAVKGALLGVQWALRVKA
ncbi:MAG: DUF983 domain-containing protein [Alphaproteobacteria bacterium]